ncbi:hypothetical protein HUW51_00895 (plasmid) [Adhaeribacter swui]|uniref:DUF3408 domain-containing protein n=1 Tax=Adhaeribacter swui TaxID=2086471 RepID=A0A7G7G2G1_9BACT|nr:hypothetical protein [Adhaeribacter swui]QNF31345.1 hypothetical protein HUW51_00895 [Adhaeribacter swui]
MSKDLLQKLKASATEINPVEPVKPEASAVTQPIAEAKSTKDKPAVAKSNPVAKKGATKPGKPASGLTGFEDLYEILKQEKEDFTFNKRMVYIDDDIADVLDLIKREAKINSNLLASYLLKQFFTENIGLIKALKEKRKGNKFLD